MRKIRTRREDKNKINSRIVSEFFEFVLLVRAVVIQNCPTAGFGEEEMAITDMRKRSHIIVVSSAAKVNVNEGRMG